MDAGVFLGASTVAFNAGLRTNSRWQSNYAKLKADSHLRPVNTYEIARWVEGMEKIEGWPSIEQRGLKGRYHFSPGDSFEPLLRELLRGQHEHVSLHICDVTTIESVDAPVEIAFYDCLKTKERDWKVFKAFGPFYVPGRTIIIHQDWFFERAAELKVRQEYLAGYFRYLGRVKDSALFLLERPLVENLFRDDILDALSLEDKLRLLRQAARRADERVAELRVRLSGVHLCKSSGDIERARIELGSIVEEFDDCLEGPNRRGVFVRMRKAVKTMEAQLERR